MRMVFAVLITLAMMPAVTIATSSDASAQATCRNKCNSEEQACLKRTNNKSQCGNRAQSCSAKCR